MILLILNSLYIFGLFKAAEFRYINDKNPWDGIEEDSKMALWWFRDASIKVLGKFYSKPLFTCPICMSSVHSLYIYWPYILYQYGFDWKYVAIYPVYIGVLAGVNWIVSEVMNMINSVSDYLNHH